MHWLGCFRGIEFLPGLAFRLVFSLFSPSVSEAGRQPWGWRRRKISACRAMFSSRGEEPDDGHGQRWRHCFGGRCIELVLQEGQGRGHVANLADDLGLGSNQASPNLQNCCLVFDTFTSVEGTRFGLLSTGDGAGFGYGVTGG